MSRPYDRRAGAWERRDAVHLLHRTGFGASAGAVDRALEAGLEATVDRLVSTQPETENFEKTAAVLRRSALSGDSIEGLKNWWLYRMIHTANPLAERMALLWHNHFATSWAKVRSVSAMADQNQLIRSHALGSFRALVHGMCRDVAMLVWLDGNANRKRQLNENFARELMELFTLGEGNYSERDIKEAARGFSGWHVRQDEFWFNALQHDRSPKRIFGQQGDFDGDEVAGLCLAQPACLRFIAVKLLRQFVVDAPGEGLVDGLADRIRKHDFDMAATMRDLLLSRAFFAPAHRRSLIKSPVALVAGTCRTLGLQTKLGECTRLMAELGQNLLEPPTVKGWEGGRLWINTGTMLQRANFAAGLATGQKFGRLDRPMPRRAEDLAELLFGADLPEAVMKEAARQNAEGRLQLFLSLPEYQLC